MTSKYLTKFSFSDVKALRQLEYVLQGKRKPEISELNVILDDLQQEDILRSAGPLYAEELYKIRSTQNTPLTLEQVEAILQGLLTHCPMLSSLLLGLFK